MSAPGGDGHLADDPEYAWSDDDQSTENTQPFVAADLVSWVSRDGKTWSTLSGLEITEPLRISEQNGTTLRHALKGHGLPVSGAKREQAVRLANAGVTAEHVDAWHTWRGRDSGPCSQHEPLCPEAPSPGGRVAGYVPVPIGADDCLCAPSSLPASTPEEGQR